MSNLQFCRVVLLEPHYPGNIGATARVMTNMGLNNLVLVNPIADPLDPAAKQMSTHGESILHAARTVASFEDAVSDCVLVAGTSAKQGGLYRRQSVADPDTVAELLVREIQQRVSVALVFGSEPNGISNDIATKCHHLIRIPTDADYSSLNLAQAVAISLYELRKAWDRLESNTEDADAMAPMHLQELMFAQLQSSLESLHFLFGTRAKPLMHALRHLIGKAKPTTMEVKLLIGLARQIRWYIDHHP